MRQVALQCRHVEKLQISGTPVSVYKTLAEAEVTGAFALGWVAVANSKVAQKPTTKKTAPTRRSWTALVICDGVSRVPRLFVPPIWSYLVPGIRHDQLCLAIARVGPAIDGMDWPKKLKSSKQRLYHHRRPTIKSMLFNEFWISAHRSASFSSLESF